MLDDRSGEYDNNWFQIGEHVIQGYLQERDFPKLDLGIIPFCMRARLGLSLIYGLRTAYVNYRKVNTDYILKTQSNGWKVLKV